MALANLEAAGVAAERALTTIAREPDSPRLGQRAGNAATAVASGRSLAEAGLRAGLFTASEAALIGAATQGGSPEPIYRRLAEGCEDRRLQRRLMRRRLMLPAGMLVLAVFVAPLADLVAGRVAAAQYFALTVGFLLKLSAVAWLLAKLPQWLRDRPPTRNSISRGADWMLLRVPVFGARQRRKAAAAYLETLGLLLEAGLPAVSAATSATQVVANSAQRDELAKMLPHLRAGRTLAAAMRDQRSFDATCVQLVNTGEHAGRLPEMVLRVARSEREISRAFEAEVARWLPRLAYLCVVIGMASSLLG
ncbi:MAG: type II secretion system F family protein [Gammaproteobacteria bacterium]|nr:type II secretion system F family protein [Gammaproteobacteria bacterium]